MQLGAASSSESESERHFSGAKLHQPPGRASMSVPHIGKLVFVRDEMRNEQGEEATEMYTDRHMDELEASGQLELH